MQTGEAAWCDFVRLELWNGLRGAAGEVARNDNWSAAALGDAEATALRDASFRIYEAGRAHAAARGIIIADTKFEFGLDRNG